MAGGQLNRVHLNVTHKFHIEFVISDDVARNLTKSVGHSMPAY